VSSKIKQYGMGLASGCAGEGVSVMVSARAYIVGSSTLPG
jgi:hypothetical protein